MHTSESSVLTVPSLPPALTKHEAGTESHGITGPRLLRSSDSSSDHLRVIAGGNLPQPPAGYRRGPSARRAVTPAPGRARGAFRVESNPPSSSSHRARVMAAARRGAWLRRRRGRWCRRRWGTGWPRRPRRARSTRTPPAAQEGWLKGTHG